MQTTDKAGLVLMAALVCAACPAMAQSTAGATPSAAPVAAPADDDGARQTTFLMQFAANNTAFDQTIERAALDQFKRQITECQTPEKAVRQLPTRYGRISFPPTTPDNRFPYPDYGVWVEHVKIRACNKLWTINMLAIARDKLEPLLLATLPGETLADPAAMHDTVRLGETGIKKAAAASCPEDPKIAYTRLLGYKQPDGKLGSADAHQGWFEEWEYTYCGNVVPVQIVYLPNDKGSVDIKTRVVPTSMPKVPTQKPAQTPAAQTAPTPATTPPAATNTPAAPAATGTPAAPAAPAQ